MSLTPPEPRPRHAADTGPQEPLPAEAVPADPWPALPAAPADAVPAEPVPAEPVPAEPVSAEPVSAEPVPAEEIPGDVGPADTLPAGAGLYRQLPADDAPTTVVAAQPAAGLPGPPGPDAEPESVPPPPALLAEGLGLSGHGGTVFTGFDAEVHGGDVLLVVGPAGSGRSTLLLALCGRFAVTSGRLQVAGHTDPDLIRRVTAVARIDDLVDTEERLTVGEAIAERALIDGVTPTSGAAAVARAADVMGLELDRDALTEDLGGAPRTLVAVALAASRPASVIVLDDLDRGLDFDSQRRVLDCLVALAADGTAVVATTAQALPMPPGAHQVFLRSEVIDLPVAGGPQAAAEGETA